MMPISKGTIMLTLHIVLGRSQAVFAVEVLVHPHFIDEFPKTEFVQPEGERLVMDCSVGGNPEPKVTFITIFLNTYFLCDISNCY